MKADTETGDKIKDFLREIISVCEKHRLSLSHEDIHGGFEVECFDEFFSEWLMEAQDRTKRRVG